MQHELELQLLGDDQPVIPRQLLGDDQPVVLSSRSPTSAKSAKMRGAAFHCCLVFSAFQELKKMFAKFRRFTEISNLANDAAV